MAFIYDLTDTWNAGGTTFNAIKMNVTDSASAAASKLVTLQVGGSERFGVRKDGVAFASNGLAVGTTTPAGRLHTQLDTSFSWGDGWSNGVAVFGGATSTSGALAISYNDTDGGTIGAITPGTAWRPVRVFSDNIQFCTNGSTERVRITSAGNVGIGTSSPSARLDVSAGTNLNIGFQQLVLDNFTGEGIGYTLSRTTSDDDLMAVGVADSDKLGLFSREGIIFGTGGAALYGQTTERMRIDSSGNVGIGTSSPGMPLDVQANASALGIRIRGRAADNFGFFQFSSNNLASSAFIGSNGSLLQFETGGSERMRIDSSGNVGVGTSSPSQKLTVAGNIELFQGADRFIKLGSSTNYNYTLSAVGDDFQILEAGTTPRLTIRYPNGNVGIGTSSPGVALDVFSAAGPIIKSRSSTVSTTLRGFEIQTANDIHASFRSEPSSGELRIAAGFSTWGGYQTFYTNGTERMRIDSSGNLLVGTTSNPDSSRMVVTGGSITHASTQLNTRPGTSTQYEFVNRNGAGFDFYVNNASNLAARIDSSGNVGIGTSSPGQRLAVAGNLRVGDSAEPNTYNINIVARSPAAGTLDWDFNTNDATHGARTVMTLRPTGNVGIGTSSPGARLHIAGSADIRLTNTANTSGFDIGLLGGASDATAFVFQRANSAMVFGTNNTERARIDSSGNLLVGTTTQLASTRQTVVSGSNGVAVQVANGAVGSYMTNTSGTGDWQPFSFNVNGTSFTQVGSITITGGTTTNYNTSSDYRLKDIAGPIQNSGAYIDALKPVQGSWKADGSRFIGLLAHEVQEVSETQIATGEKDGEEMQAMDYSAPEIIANLIAEVQSLRARVAQLEGN